MQKNIIKPHERFMSEFINPLVLLVPKEQEEYLGGNTSHKPCTFNL